MASIAGENRNEATAVAPTTPAQSMITAVGPMASATGPTMMMGRKLARLTSVLRTPNTRPRTSSGSSSWSAVCAGTATNAYEMPAVNATRTLTLRSDSRPSLGRPRPCAAPRMSSETPSDTRPISMSRLRATNRPNRCRMHDADDEADAERQHQHPEVGRLETQGLDRERGPEHAQDADERRRDGQVGQRPEDVVVVRM